MLQCFSCQIYILLQVSCQYHYWFWSYDNFFYKGLTRNLKITSSPVWIRPISGDWDRVSCTKFGTNISHEKLLNAGNCQDYSFYRFWAIKGKNQQGQGVKLPPTYLVLITIKSIKKTHFLIALYLYLNYLI